MNVLDFLRALELAIPPPPNCHHVLARCHYGSDTVGWDEKLAVQVNVAGTFHAFFLDDADQAKPSEKLADEIATELAKSMPNVQHGVAKGQFMVADAQPTEHEKAAAPAMRAALEALLEVSYAPEARCSCHLSPPCGDCVEFGATREAMDDARVALRKADGPAIVKATQA